MLQDPEPKRTPLSEVGEFGLIEKISSLFSLKDPGTLKGIGDDAAVFQHPNELSLVSTDLLAEGIHFDLSYTPLPHLGYKAAVVNFSDIYAMGGKPRQLLVSLALSNRFPVEAVEQIYEGIRKACDLYQVDLVGGDTTSSKSGLILNLTAIGSAPAEHITYRDGAKENDLIVVSGDLGAAYMGLQILEREKRIFLENPGIQPDLQGNEYVLERQLKPEARKDIPELLRELGTKPTSMIDLSDGLSSDLLHLCKASKLGCRIFEDKVPMDPQVIRLGEEFGINPITAAMNGGEDYELLFTIPIEDYKLIKANPHLTPIGHMTAPSDGHLLVLNDGHTIELKAQGWNHLANNNTDE
jgi:thiamine-monophosphate kinase